MHDIYSKNYKRMVLIPLLILIPLILFAFFVPGVKEGIDLTGGNVLIIRSDNPVDPLQIEEILLKDFNLQR